jgi:hypothetical protein
MEEGTGGGSVTKEVFVFPLTEAAVRWLESHVDELETAFTEIHRGEGSETEHPHRVGVMARETKSGGFDPEDPPLYVYVPAHWDSEHLRRTKRDVTKVLSRLGADLSDFEIEASE